MPADWQPACGVVQLRQRARLLERIRTFFAARGVLEVETPLLCHNIGTDPNLDFFSTSYNQPHRQQTLYLQTSPEFAMKRLLAADSGSIYQICKAFRNGEAGRLHNPEFTLLEWYRVGFDLPALMDEIGALMGYLAPALPPWQRAERYSYRELFNRYTGLDALEFSLPVYRHCAEARGLPEAAAICGSNHALWLDLLFSHLVQPHLGHAAVCLVHDYPACQSSLARLKPGDPQVTERVEIFLRGVELGNGFHELADAGEQERRFLDESALRRRQGLPPVDADPRLLAALQAGLPDCSGMAIGLDRLMLLLHGYAHIETVLAFPVSRA